MEMASSITVTHEVVERARAVVGPKSGLMRGSDIQYPGEMA